jgi:hypothetical protein
MELLLTEAALSIELPRKFPGIGLEPTTRDNPQLRPIKSKADKKVTVELPGVLPLHHPRNGPRGGIEPPLPGPDNPRSTAR